MTGDRELKVLVVCTGNICRSPMGELLLRHELRRAAGPGSGGIVVASAGTYPGHAGEPMQPGAAAVMGERGIEHAGFRATALTTELVRGHDLILTAERSHRTAVVRLDAAAADRTFTLVELGRLAVDLDPGSFASGADGLADLARRAAAARSAAPPADPSSDDIDDPYALPVSEFRRCAERIDAALAPVVRAITPRP